MIPPIIHYCWFGPNPKSELAKKCIESWKKYCPDYELREWNENNFDINLFDYTKEAYEERKWAFITDVVRLYALINYGGIYMDTDVEVLKPLDSLLSYSAVSGFESNKQIPTGLMACEKGNCMFAEFLEDYTNAHFKRKDGSLDITTNVTRITKVCLRYGLVQNNTLQTVNGFTLLPKEYLCPKDLITKELKLTENSFTIHHFDGSWKDDAEKYTAQLSERLDFKGGSYIAKLISTIRYDGFCKALKESFGWIKRKREDKTI